MKPLFVALFCLTAFACSNSPSNIPPSTERFVENLLEGRKPENNYKKEAMVCLEGLTNPEEATRKYYFRVVPLLIKNTDPNEELSARIGSNLTEYLKQYPVELANQFHELPPEEKTHIGAVISIHFMTRFTPDETIKHFFDELSSKCSNEKEKENLLELKEKVFHP